METPFSKRMKQFAEEKKVDVQAFSPVQKPTMNEGRAPLLGEIKSADPRDLAIESERNQMKANLEGSKAQVQQAAQALRQQVASGQISEADAEHQMDLLVNKLTDNSYMGWGDFDMRTRAAGFGDKAEAAYGMYGMGMDPALLAREQQRLEAQKGVLSDMGMSGEPLQGEGLEPPMGEGRAPLMGE